jgi:hypothetical protein
MLTTLDELSIFGCDFDEALPCGKRFNENMLDKVRRYCVGVTQIRTSLSTAVESIDSFLRRVQEGYTKNCRTLSADTISLPNRRFALDRLAITPSRFEICARLGSVYPCQPNN